MTYLCCFSRKARVGAPYVPLAYQFSLKETPTRRNILRARNVFNATVGRRLFHLHRAKDVRAHLPDDWPDRFKDTLLIGDGYPKSIMKSGTFIIQRITWSVYKHDNIFLVMICKCRSVLALYQHVNVFYSVISPDGLIQMRSLVYGGQSAEVTTIINKSGILNSIRGNSPSGSVVCCFC
jgi:hypothetical protein